MKYYIYFLLRDKTVIYIGQTGRLKERLYHHKSKAFDSVRSIECLPERLNYYEARWIRRFKPILNKTDVCAHTRLAKETDRVRATIYLNETLNEMALKACKSLGRSFNNYVETLILEDCKK